MSFPRAGVAFAVLVAVAGCTSSGSGSETTIPESAPTARSSSTVTGPSDTSSSGAPRPTGAAVPATSDATVPPIDETVPQIDRVEPRPAVEPVGAVTHGTLRVAGADRTYRLYVPESLRDVPVPLVVGLHGGTGWGDQFATTNHIEGLAESNGFIVVHPDGVRVAGGRGGVWNGGICCGVAAREGVDDVRFLETLIDEVELGHDIDPQRVFAFGHSNGGIMSYRLACELADRITGIGVVAGTLGVDRCRPSQPVSVIHVHGTADENLPIDGGIGPRSIAGVDFPSPRDGFRRLAGLDVCPPPEETTEGAITTALREPCDEGAAAAFVTIENANHSWPGGAPRFTPAAGEGYAGYDATFEIVAFLLSNPRR